MDDERELIDKLRKMSDISFPTGHAHLGFIIENQQLIARGIAKVLDLLPDDVERGFGHSRYDG